MFIRKTKTLGIGTSPFSVYVENLSNLNLNRVEKKKSEKQIDKIYEKLDQSKKKFQRIKIKFNFNNSLSKTFFF